jgi:hypothetical protein
MKDRKVVVQGSGKNLFKISEYSGKFTIYQVDVGLLANSHNIIWKASSLEDARSIMRSYSSREIKEVTSW